MDKLVIIKEAWNMFKRRQKLRLKKMHQFEGNDIEICEQIVKQCFNGRYFQTSLGHFSAFYMRDFGICCVALLELGYKNEVKKTLQFALNIYQKNNRITTTITKKGEVVDIFSYSPDSLAFLLRSLRVAKLNDLIKTYEPFLNEKIKEYYELVIDKKTGLVRKDKQFSSMKDHSKVKSTMYNNSMVAMLKQEIELINTQNLKPEIKLIEIKLINPFKEYDYKLLLLQYFWNNSYFNDGLKDLENKKEDKNKTEYIAGDANVFPYWCDIYPMSANKINASTRKMFASSLQAIQKERLDQPMALCYTKEQLQSKYLFLQSILANNYEGNTIWIHLGLCYLDLIAKYDQKLLEIYLEQYKEMIVKHKNFLEIYNKNKTIFKTFFYHCDEGMLWASKYLQLRRKLIEMNNKIINSKKSKEYKP